MVSKSLMIGLVLLTLPTGAARGQLNTMFDDILDSFLREEFHLSPGPHAEHFFPAAQLADSLLIPALNSLVASNVSSFPLSSTVAGVTFDFSTGQPVGIRESLGPIFAETAQTLGRGKMALGFNLTHLSLDRLRGMPLEDMRFTFTHEDIREPGLGDDPTESDLVDVYMGLNIDANIYAFFATYGLTGNLDIGVAVPIVTLSMDGTARAVITSYTLFVMDEFGGGARHFFGGDNEAPILEKEMLYESSTTGIGDVAVRLKYRFPTQSASGLAALADVRIPTGDQDNFLSTGSLNYTLSLVGSTSFGDFTPHANVGYSYRGADFDSNELELIAGFDQRVTSGLTFAFDFLGDIDLQREEAIELLPGTETIIDHSPDVGSSAERIVDLSNVPERDYDHTLNASFGFRGAPSDQLQFLVNLIVPLSTGGLQSKAVPTAGVSFSF